MKKNINAIKLGRLGGKARFKSTTKKQRIEWARKGGLAPKRGTKI